MSRRVRTIVLLTLAAAAIVFLYVQDRITARGARDYVMQQRQAIAGQAPPVTVDQVMGPAVQRSVAQGLTSAAVVLVIGFGAAVAVGRRRA
jgi:ABC-type Fe3+ transport system permease subunit